MTKHYEKKSIFVQYYEAPYADNARTLWIWFDVKLREVYATNDFTVVRKWQ